MGAEGSISCRRGKANLALATGPTLVPCPEARHGLPAGDQALPGAPMAAEAPITDDRVVARTRHAEAYSPSGARSSANDTAPRRSASLASRDRRLESSAA